MTERVVASPESCPCQNGEAADRARRRDSRLRRPRCATRAAEVSGRATWT